VTLNLSALSLVRDAKIRWRQSGNGWRGWRTRSALVAVSVTLGALIGQLWPVFIVSGNSMTPTLRHGDWVIASRLSYHLSSIVVGDVAVISYPGGAGALVIKRVVAGPNDTVELRKGQLFVNWTERAEPYTEDAGRGDTTLPPIRVPAAHYWVLSDNRSGSVDSRTWGPIPRQQLRAKVVYSAQSDPMFE
jgi:signal peptidase I